MIQFSSVSKSFKKKNILSNITFEIKPGEVCGLVGLNGVGKTTLIRLIAGTLTPSSGDISVLNSSGERTGSFYRRVGIVLDSDGFNGNLSFTENLKFFAKAKRLSPQYVNQYIVDHWNHLAEKTVQVKKFSRGERMQCSLARAFLGDPELLLLDEPASNLDMDGFDLLQGLVSSAKKRGSTVLISSHRLDAISTMCESALFLEGDSIEKVELLEESSSVWQINGENLTVASDIISKFGAEIVTSNDSSIYFKGITKETIPQLMKKLIDNGIVFWEIFQKDQILSEMGRL